MAVKRVQWQRASCQSAGFGILIAVVIAEYAFKRGAWLQYRAQILSLYAMFSLSVDFQTASFFIILPTYSEAALMTLSVLSFLFNVGVFAYMVFTMQMRKMNPITQEIYAHAYFFLIIMILLYGFMALRVGKNVENRFKEASK